MSVKASFNLAQYAFYNDGTESGSTIIGSANSQQELDCDTTYICRVEIVEENGAGGDCKTPEWEYNHNGGGWVDVTTSSSVVKAVSGGLVDGNDTTQRLGSGSFISTNAWQSEDGPMPTLTYAASEVCEGALNFQVIAADVSDGDEVLLRMVVHTYTYSGADIDVNKPAAARRIFVVT